MQATPIDSPFDDPAYLFEPWWPGARALAFVEGGRLRLQVEQLSDPLIAFPELADLPTHLRRDGVVIDATLLVLDLALPVAARGTAASRTRSNRNRTTVGHRDQMRISVRPRLPNRRGHPAPGLGHHVSLDTWAAGTQRRATALAATPAPLPAARGAPHRR
jgi:hypothetical protein